MNSSSWNAFPSCEMLFSQRFFSERTRYRVKLSLPPSNNHTLLFRFWCSKSKSHRCKHTTEFQVFIQFIIASTDLTKGSCFLPGWKSNQRCLFWGSVFSNPKPIKKNSLQFQKSLVIQHFLRRLSADLWVRDRGVAKCNTFRTSCLLNVRSFFLNQGRVLTLGMSFNTRKSVTAQIAQKMPPSH